MNIPVVIILCAWSGYYIYGRVFYRVLIILIFTVI